MDRWAHVHTWIISLQPFCLLIKKGGEEREREREKGDNKAKSNCYSRHPSSGIRSTHSYGGVVPCTTPHPTSLLPSFPPTAKQSKAKLKKEAVKRVPDPIRKTNAHDDTFIIDLFLFAFISEYYKRMNCEEEEDEAIEALYSMLYQEEAISLGVQRSTSF